MTREEAIKILLHCGTENYCHHYIRTGNCHGCNRREALDMAVEALSTDTISREEAIHAIDLCRERKNKEIDELRTKWLEAEQRADRPKGEWIFNPTNAIDLMFAKPKCSRCGFESSDGGNFCPNCGARLR